MCNTKQISPEQVYDLFPYPGAPDDNTFFCMVFDKSGDGAHPYLRTGNTYKYVEDHEFVKILSEIYPGLLRYPAIPYSDSEIKYTLKVEPYRLVDQVLVDRRTGQAYREIMQCH